MNPNEQRISVGEVSLHVKTLGQGPAVLMCHGFPECSEAWHHQMQALALAGYRAIAPDMRGYGMSDAPQGVEHYHLLHLVGDMVGLLDALEVQQAVVVGHDWGAPVAWTSAMLRPDRFVAVAALSVPFFPRGSSPPVASMPFDAHREFYQLYFQRVGQAEAELSADLRGNLLRAAWHWSGEGPPVPMEDLVMVPKNGGWLRDRSLPQASQWPTWLRPQTLEAYVQAFERSGFEGPLNWYRNLDTNWRLLRPWHDARVQVPAMYLVGERDLLMGFPIMDWLLPRLSQFVPRLVHQEVVPGCGHWIQRERPDLVNQRLLTFLTGLSPTWG